VKGLLAALWLAAAAAGPLAAAAPVQIHVSLEPQVIGIDETATLTIEAEGGGISSLQFTPELTLDNLERVDGGSQFEDLNLVNGNLSRSFRYALRLRPVAVGPARVRLLVLHLRGQMVRLPDQVIHVQQQPAGQPAGGTPPAGPGGALQPRDPADLFEQLFGAAHRSAEPPAAPGPAAFLRAEVQPAKPLVGEQAIYTLYLYTRQDVAAINATAMPTFRGFWVKDLPQPERLTPEMVTTLGARYGRVAILRKALFGLRPGPHPLEPAGCDVVIEPPSRGFFGPLPMARPEELHLRTPDLAVDVQPLPAAPPDFGGLVGQVSLTARLQPYSLRIGEGATLTVTLAGAGNLQGVAPPRLDLPGGLSAFPPQQQSEDHLNGATVAGQRIWTFVLVPRLPGRFAVRPQAITYFDPGHREYRLAESPPLSLTALPAPAAASAAAPAGTGGAGRHPGPDAAPHGEARDGWWSWPPHGWASLLPWLALAWGAVLTVLVVRRRAQPAVFAGTAPAARTGAAGGGAGPGGGSAAAEPSAAGAGATDPAELERKLREAAREDRPRQAAALVEQGWRDYLAGRWGVPATMPPRRWAAALASQGAPPDLADQLVSLVEDLHYLRYAPQLSTTAAVRDQLLAGSRRLLRRLR
jgi:hypothetical protein